MNNLIPIFLDYTGTINNLIVDGTDELIKFNSLLNSLSLQQNAEVFVVVVSGCSLINGKKRFKKLIKTATKTKSINYFKYFIAEYCGFLIDQKFKVNKLLDFSSLIKYKRKLKKVLKRVADFDYKICNDYKSVINIHCDSLKLTSNEDKQRFYKFIDKINLEVPKQFEITNYYDEYGIECDVKLLKQTKSNAINYFLNKYSNYNINFVVCGGDNSNVDAEMRNIDVLNYFLIPNGERSNLKNVIVSNKKNIQGINECLQKLLKILEDKNEKE